MIEQTPSTVLGISWGHSDPSVCLVHDHSIVAYVEEERLSRVKHAFGNFPARALVECLQIGNFSISDVDAISINWDLAKYESGQMEYFYNTINALGNPNSKTLDWQKKTLHTYTSSTVKNYLRARFKEIFDTPRIPRLLSFGHHYIHAWQAVAMSGFKEANALVIDGSGDDLCSSLWVVSQDNTELIHSAKIPDSLGWFYAAITEFLGFKAYDGEYKVNAMAAYGQYDAAIDRAMNDVLSVDGAKYSLNRKFIHDGDHSFSDRYTDALPEKLGIAPKMISADFTQQHFDLAFAAQRQLERSVLAFLPPQTINTSRALCISGGVALNVTLSAHIQQALLPNTPIFVNPLASDAGAVLGAALRGGSSVFPSLDERTRTLGLGRMFSNRDILIVLGQNGLMAKRAQLDYSDVAKLLLEGAIVAWFQGRAEAGPRALGFRSILCDPRNAQAANKLTMIKQRATWQPYGVSMQQEYSHTYLTRPIWSDNMSISVPVSRHFADVASPSVHKDGSVRPHIVRKELQPEFHALLTSFGALSGIFALINTSLNRRGEPIAYSPQDAVAIFTETDIDVMVMSNFVVNKLGDVL